MAKSARLLLVALLASAAAVRAADRWLLGKSPHFEMYSDESEPESRLILTGLEEFRANFLRLLPLNGASEPRTSILVFDRESAFRPYKPLYQGKPRDLAGYFLPGSDEVTIAMTTDIPNPEQDPRQVIYHEYVHLLLNARDARYPLWLNEGLAEVFSTFRVVDGKVEFGVPLDHHVALLQRSALWPLPRLFAVTPGSPDYNEETRTGIFYAESWAFTHYLLFGADRSNAGKLGQFALRLARGSDVAASFRQSFGLDFAAQEGALQRYLSGGGYIKTRTPAVAQNIPVTFRPASDLERRTALLNLRWRVHQSPDAAAAAFALLKQDPSQARPHELLAAIAASAGDLTTAQEHWRAAVDRNSDNAWVYLQLLREALAPYEGADMLDVRLAPELIAPWRTWASRAWDLSPENPEAAGAALTVETLAEKMDLGVGNRGQRQVMRLHDPARALLALAIIHWRCDQAESARRLLTLVEAEPKADMTTRAAANALRYRLPPAQEVAGPAGLVDPSHASAIALRTAHEGDAATFLDQLLATRGSTAPRLKLPRWVARMPAHAGPTDWERADALRERAQAGDADAMFDLAVAFACGAGVEFSPSLARDWLQQAAGHGHSLAELASPAGQANPASIVQFLRAKHPASAEHPLPPLDAELQARIAEAAAASDHAALAVVYRPAPRFPPDLAQRGGKGEAVVRFTIRADGHPDQIQANEFSDSACASAAEECAAGWRFVPTIRDGKPVATLAEVTIAFEVEAKSAPAQLDRAKVAAAAS